MHPIILNDAERALLAPALQRVVHYGARQREALDEVGRLLSMRTGLPPERLTFDPQTHTVSELPCASPAEPPAPPPGD